MNIKILNDDIYKFLSLEEYNKFDNIFRKKNTIISPFENPFLQHLFFDSYIKEERGNNPMICAETFYKIIFYFSSLINKSNTRIHNDTLTHINNQIAFSIKNNLYFSNATNIDKIKNNKDIFDELSKQKEVLILGGWQKNQGGHSIVIHITENSSNNNYDIYIFNSGEGVYNQKIDSKTYIGIKIKNCNKPHIENLLNLIKFCLYNGEEKKHYLDALYKLKHNYQLVFIDQDIEYNHKIIEIISNLKNKNQINSRNEGNYYAKYIYPFSEEEKTFLNIDKKGFTSYDLAEIEKNIKIVTDFNQRFNSYYITENFNEDYASYFYNNLFMIFRDNKKKGIFKDALQMSGSCTFFSLFYFIKYNLFKKINPSFFETFYTFLKNKSISYLIQFLIHIDIELNHKNNNILENINKLNLFTNSFYLLLKDNPLPIQIKNIILQSLENIYSYKYIQPLSTQVTQNKYQEIKDESSAYNNKINELFTHYASIKNKYNAFFDLNNKYTTLIENIDYYKNNDIYIPIFYLSDIFKDIAFVNQNRILLNNKNNISIYSKDSYKKFLLKDNHELNNLLILYKSYLIDIFHIIFHIIRKNQKYVIKYNYEINIFENNKMNISQVTNKYDYYIEHFSSSIYLQDLHGIKYEEGTDMFDFLFIYFLLKAENKKRHNDISYIYKSGQFIKVNISQLNLFYNINDSHKNYILSSFLLNKIYKNKNNIHSFLSFISFDLNIAQFYQLLLDHKDLLFIKNSTYYINNNEVQINRSYNLYPFNFNNILTILNPYLYGKFNLDYILSNQEKYISSSSNVDRKIDFINNTYLLKECVNYSNLHIMNQDLSLNEILQYMQSNHINDKYEALHFSNIHLTFKHLFLLNITNIIYNTLFPELLQENSNNGTTKNYFMYNMNIENNLPVPLFLMNQDEIKENKYIHHYFNNIKNIDIDLFINECKKYMNVHSYNVIYLFIIYHTFNKEKNIFKHPYFINTFKNTIIDDFLNHHYFEHKLFIPNQTLKKYNTRSFYLFKENEDYITDINKLYIQKYNKYNYKNLTSLFLFSLNEDSDLYTQLYQSYQTYLEIKNKNLLLKSVDDNSENHENSTQEEKVNSTQEEKVHKDLINYSLFTKLKINHFYVHNDDLNKSEQKILYYRILNNKVIQYHFIYKNNQLLYNNPLFNHNHYKYIINKNDHKLLYIFNHNHFDYLTFENNNTYIYLLLHHSNYIFLYNQLNNTYFLYDTINHQKYIIILNKEKLKENKLFNFYYGNVDNILLLKNIETKEFKLISFISSFYINHKINSYKENDLFTYGNSFKKIDNLKIPNINNDLSILLYTFDNHLFTIKSNNLLHISIYMILLGLNYQYLPLLNIYNIYKNLIHNTKNNNDIIEFNKLCMEKNYYNTPLWPYFNNISERSYFMHINENKPLKLKDIKKDNNDKIIDNIHKIISTFFESFKKIDLSSLKKVSVYSKLNDTLKEFYDSICFYCKSNKIIKYINNHIESTRENSSNTKKIFNSFFDLKNKHYIKLQNFNTHFHHIYQNNILQSIFTYASKKNNKKPLYSKLFDVGNMYNMNNIILENRKILYNMTYLKNVFTILNEVENILFTKNKERTFHENCLMIGELYKSIDLNVIHSYHSLLQNKKEKPFFEILFELENGYYIRKQQTDFINLIYHNISQNNYEVAYQLLMGMGKSTLITPLILFNEYFIHQKNRFMIILPSHLVNSSFDIFLTFMKFFDKNINLVKVDNKINSFKKLNTIYIVSDTVIKYSLLNNIMLSHKNNQLNQHISEFIDPNTFVIMDEIDSMIDPLKSNLNISTNNKRPHKYLSIIVEIFYNIFTNNLNINSTNLNQLFEKLYNANNTNRRNQISSTYWQNKCKKKVKEIVDLVSNWDFNREYGFGDYDENQLLNYFTCIPFEKNNKPINGSKFTEFELYLSVTILGYINCWNKEYIRIKDLEKLILHIYDFLITYKYLNIDYNILVRNFYPVFYTIFKDDLNDIIDTLENKRYELESLLESLILKNKDALTTHKNDLLKTYLLQIIIPQFFNIDDKHWNISFIEILGLLNQKVLFSGTPYFNIPFESINHMFEGNIPFDKFIINNKMSGGSIWNDPNNDPEFYGYGSGSYENGSHETGTHGFVNVLNLLNNKNLELEGINFTSNSNNGLILNKLPRSRTIKRSRFTNNGEIGQEYGISNAKQNIERYKKKIIKNGYQYKLQNPNANYANIPIHNSYKNKNNSIPNNIENKESYKSDYNQSYNKRYKELYIEKFKKGMIHRNKEINKIKEEEYNKQRDYSYGYNTNISSIDLNKHTLLNEFIIPNHIIYHDFFKNGLRKRIEYEKESQKEGKAATKIQTQIRIKRNKKLYEQMLKNKEAKTLSNAATKIQTQIRIKRFKELLKEKINKKRELLEKIKKYKETYPNELHQKVQRKINEKLQKINNVIEDLKIRIQHPNVQNNLYDLSNYSFDIKEKKINLSQTKLNNQNKLEVKSYKNALEKTKLINHHNFTPPLLSNKRENGTKINNISNNYVTSLINSIVKDNYSEGAIKSSFIGLLSNKKPEIKYNNSNTSSFTKNNNHTYHLNIQNIHLILSKLNEYLLLDYLFIKKEILHYQSLIDVGGILLETPKSHIIQFLYTIFEGKRKILYVNEDNIKKIYSGTIDSEINYNNEVFHPNELFIYYDQKNSVGIDFKQPLFMHGLVTTLLSNKITDVAQGIFRLRKMNITHTIDFYLNQNDYHTLTNKNSNHTSETLLLKLYNILLENGNQYINHTLPYIQLQILKYLYRKFTNKNESFLENIDYLLELKENENIFFTSFIQKFKSTLEITSDININSSELNFMNSITYEMEKEKNKNENESKNVSKSVERLQTHERDYSRNYEQKLVKYSLLKKVYLTQFLNGNICISQFINPNNHTPTLPNSNILQFENSKNYYQIDLLGNIIHLSNEILIYANEKLLNPYKMYYIVYDNSKHILIGTYEYLHFIYMYQLYKDNLNKHNKNNNIRKIFNQTSNENINTLFSKFKIYDNNGKNIFNISTNKNLFKSNNTINNNIPEENKLFIELFYYIVFNKKYDNLHILYTLFNKIVQENNNISKINDLMNFIEKRSSNYIVDRTNHYNISSYALKEWITNPSDENILKLFKFNTYSLDENQKRILLDYIKYNRLRLV